MKRYLPEINSRVRYISESEERAAINTPVQGTAAELLKLAMIDIDKKLTIQYPDSRMLLNIHDELIVEAPEDQVEDVADLIKDTMEKVMILCVPIEAHVGIGDNWAEAK
jgi:DNA polymerase-1